MSEPNENKQYANDMVDKIKKLVKQGNVNRIRILRKDQVVLNIPVNVGLLGAVIGVAAAPWALILGAVAAYGLDCRIEIEKKDGQVIDVDGKPVEEAAEPEKTVEDIVEEVVEEAPEIIIEDTPPEDPF